MCGMKKKVKYYSDMYHAPQPTPVFNPSYALGRQASASGGISTGDGDTVTATVVLSTAGAPTPHRDPTRMVAAGRQSDSRDSLTLST